MIDKELDELADRCLRLECPSIHLEGMSASPVTTYVGPGSIERDADGQLYVRLHCQNENAASFAIANFGTGKAGKIIAASRFFSMIATDVTGRVWLAKHLLPTFETIGPGGATVVANLHEVSRTEKLPMSPMAQLTMRFPFDVAFPANTITETITRVDGEERHKRSSRDTARFEACSFLFEMSKHEGCLIVHASFRESTAPKHVEMRICETLQFVFAQEFRWCVLTLLHRKRRIMKIRSIVSRGKTRVEPPLNCMTIDRTGCLWKLFECYLAHILVFRKSSWHPLSETIFSAIESSGGPIDTAALGLCVAVEGILRNEFSEAIVVSEQTKSQIESAISLVKQSPLSESFKPRVVGSLSAMSRVRASDILEYLAKEKLISRSRVNAWKSLRNSAAHASRREGQTLRRFLKKTAEVNVLLNHLVFLAIGYTGSYSDYGTYAWPLRQFRKTLPQKSCKA